MLYLVGFFVLSYLLGSIPTSVWIGRTFYKIDIREHGSGNAGTTNTFRILGQKAGIIVFIVDVVKGVIPVLLPLLFKENLPEWGDIMLYRILCGVLSVVGHIFPAFAGFRGGKGVATSLGVAAGLHPIAALICFANFVIVLALSKYVSLGSVISGVLFALLTWFAFETELSFRIFAIVAAVLLVLTHKQNIKRLLKKMKEKLICSEERKSNLKTTKSH